MRKLLVCLLCVLISLFLITTVFAAAGDVKLLPLSKWDYKNVDGWGFYAKGGEYSWFGIVMHNPSETDCTVVLPSEVNVANNSMHKIVNTAYRLMDFGSNDFLRDDRAKIYFSGNEFTLPKKTTYAVFMDITEMEPYNQQWDTDVFFDIQVKSGKETAVIQITKGILAYDVYGTVPQKLTIHETDLPELQVTKFCRDYDSSRKILTVVFTLKNNSTVKIPVELPMTVRIEGQDKTAALRYMNCKSGDASCVSRIQKGMLDINAGETVEIRAEAPLASQPSKDNYGVETSLRYNFNGQNLIPFFVGSANSSCSAATPVPVETVTATVKPTEKPEITETAKPTEIPAVTATPEPIKTDVLSNVSFCRTYDSKTRKVSFNYALKNSTTVPVPVELATTLAVEGFQKTVPIRYLNCTAGNDSCINRIKGGYLTLNAGETALFRCEVTLAEAPSKDDFFIKTSLRYNYNGQELIPFFIGITSDTCSAAHAITLNETEITDEGIAVLNYSLTNESDKEQEIKPGTIYLHNAAIDEYIGNVIIGSLDRESTSQHSVIVTNDETFILPPRSAADITLSILTDGIDTGSLDPDAANWNYSIDGVVGNSASEKSEAKNVSVEKNLTDTDNSNRDFYRINALQITPNLPATGFSTRISTPLSVQPADLAYQSLNDLRLDIPAIDTSIEMVRVPVDENGDWAIEWLGERAAILENAPLPGTGTTVIAAHNHLNNTEAGPFLAISTLQTGDRIFINRDNGETLVFKVYANKLLKPTDGEILYQMAIPGSVVLLTCENEMPEGGYANRRAVFAEPLQ